MQSLRVSNLEILQISTFPAESLWFSWLLSRRSDGLPFFLSQRNMLSFQPPLRPVLWVTCPPESWARGCASVDRIIWLHLFLVGYAELFLKTDGAKAVPSTEIQSILNNQATHLSTHIHVSWWFSPPYNYKNLVSVNAATLLLVHLLVACQLVNFGSVFWRTGQFWSVMLAHNRNTIFFFRERLFGMYGFSG